MLIKCVFRGESSVVTFKVKFKTTTAKFFPTHKHFLMSFKKTKKIQVFSMAAKFSVGGALFVVFPSFGLYSCAAVSCVN